jgi:hypothetical protein
MTSRYGFACVGLSLLAALAGCSPDRIATPNARHPTAPATDISGLSGTDPLLYDQSASYAADIVVDEVGAYQGDDFVVPAGETWTLTQVVLSGLLQMQTLPFAIRANNAGVPGAVIQSFTLAPTASSVNPRDPHARDLLDHRRARRARRVVHLDAARPHRVEWCGFE